MDTTKRRRDTLDRYYTPVRLAHAIMARVEWRVGPYVNNPSVLVIEPHVGAGGFVAAARLRFGDRCRVVGVDRDAEAAGLKACDYALVADWRATSRDQIVRCGYDHMLLIGNPPYGVTRKGEWQEHAEHAFAVAPEATVVFLLKLSFLSGQRRRGFWARHPPCKVDVLSRRPSFTGDGATDRFTDYCVVTWPPYQMRVGTALDWMPEDP